MAQPGDRAKCWEMGTGGGGVTYGRGRMNVEDYSCTAAARPAATGDEATPRDVIYAQHEYEDHIP